MINKLRVRAQSESGFTLVELLVVMLIIGLLAAIAIPAFFNQRDKANDAEAKSTAKTVQTAFETYATDNGGNYTAPASGTLIDALRAIEPTIPASGVTVSSSAPKAYAITVTSNPSTQTFSINRATTGAVTYPCTVGGTGGCPGDADAGDDFWN
jgi:type IV pilus assembly protein PilA